VLIVQVKQKMRDAIEEQSTQLFVLAPVFLAIGIALYFDRTTEPERFIDAFVLGVVLIIMSGLSYIRSSGLYARFMAAFLMMMSFVAFGFGLADYRTSSIQTPMLKEKIFGSVVTAIVTDIEKQERATRLYLQIEKSSDSEVKALKNIRVSHRGEIPETLKAGDLVELKVVLNPPSKPLYPGGYDFGRVAYFKQIGAVGYSISDISIIKEGQGTYFFENARQTLSKTIYAHIEKDENASVINAFMTGEKKAIPEPVLERIRASGLAHLLAISGLHVGFVAGIIFFLVRGLLALNPYMALEWPIKKIAALFALLGAAYFTFIVGAAVPTQRALIMTGLVLFAVLIDRTAISMRLVALAALIILIIKPEELLNLSFQFSFAAVVALVWFYQMAGGALGYYYATSNWALKAVLYFVGLALTSLIAGLATAPFSLFYFNHFALYGVLANMLAVPVMGMIVMPFVLFTYLFMPLGIEALPLAIVDYGVTWILAVADYTASLEGAVIELPSWPHSAFILFVLSGVFLCLFKGIVSKLCALACILMGILMAYQIDYPDIIINAEKDIIAVRDSTNEYWFSNVRREKFMTDMWMSRFHQTEKHRWPKKEESQKNAPIQCDDQGCLYFKEADIIAFPKSIDAIFTDCTKADFVIAQTYFKPKFNCYKEQWLTTRSLKKYGTTLLYWQKEQQQFKSFTVQDAHGDRPWRQ